MKINDIVTESTTAGSIATVSAPMTTQSRNASIYGGKKVGNLLTGKKTNKKYANSKVNESFDTKQKVIDYFVKKGKTAAQGASAWERGWRGPKSKTSNTPVANKPRVDHMAKYDLDEAKLKEGRDGLQQKMTPMQALLGAYGLLISFGTQYLDEKGETPEAQKQLLALVQRLQKDKTLIGLDNKKIEANRDAILKHIHQMMTYAIPILQKYLPAHHFAAKRSQINGVLAAYNTARQVNEAHLEEDDLIIVPGQGHRLKSGFIPHEQDRRDHEVEMAKSDLFQAAKNAKQVYELIHDVTEEEGLEGWVQEKIIKANDYLNTIREYLEGKQLQSEMTGGVIAGGAGNFEEAAGQKYEMRFKNGKTQRFVAATPEEAKNKAKGLGATSLIKVSRDGMPQGKVLEGVGEKIKGVIRREKAKDLPVLQTRRDYAMGKAGDAYNKGEIRKGNQYSAYAEKDRKKKGDPTTNPAGTYRTKTSDYTNEGAMTTKPVRGEKPFKPSMDRPKGEWDPIHGKAPRKGTLAYDSWKQKVAADLKEAQSMGTALKNTLAKAEPGSKLDNSIKSHNRHIKAGLPGTLKNAPTGYHFDNKGYCRLGDK